MTLYRKFDKFADNSDYSSFYDDFFTYAPGAANWVETIVQAGAGSGSAVVNDEKHGVLLVTNDNADDDSYQAQWYKETFKFVSGKKFDFRARFKISEVLQSDLFMGLAVRDTSLIASAPTDGIYWRKDDGDALLDFVVRKGGTASTLTGALGTSHVMVNDTYITVGFYYDGDTTAARGARATIDAFINNVRVGSLPLTNAPDTEELAVSWAIQQGEVTNIKTMSIDYIRCRQER